LTKDWKTDSRHGTGVTIFSLKPKPGGDDNQNGHMTLRNSFLSFQIILIRQSLAFDDELSYFRFSLEALNGKAAAINELVKESHPFEFLLLSESSK